MIYIDTYYKNREKEAIMFDSFDYGWFNVGSLVLGLVAWLIPFTSIVRYKKRKTKSPLILSLLSMGACAIAL